MLLLLLFSCSVVSDSLWPPWTAACQAPLSFTISQSLLRFMTIESIMLSNHLILCRPLSPFAFSLSQHQGLFQRVSSLHQVAKVLELQLQHPYSNEYSGLISFRIDWFDLHAVQGTLKSPLQHHNLKASVLWCSAFFMIQLSHLYTTTEKTRGLTRQIFSAKWCVCFLICCLGLS